MTAKEGEESNKPIDDSEDEEEVDDYDEDESTEEGDVEEQDDDADGDDLQVDDDFALLALAKQRLSEQQAKEEAAESTKLAAEESDEGESGDDEDNASECSEKVKVTKVSPATSPERTKTEAPEVDTQPVVHEEKKDDHVVIVPDAEEPLRRRQRDENAELWALLQQSKFRIQSTRNLVIEESDIDESETGVTEDETSVDGEAKPEPSDSVVKTDEQRREEERQRKFQKENRELWELLQKSKNRLEEAAKAKIKEAAKAATADVPVPVARIENPYKDIDTVPDEAESEDALTQKELLLAMAVAEEAARSGKEVFETPSKAELRNRDINSFDFIKKELAKVPETPIGNDAKEEERERNRLALLTQALSNRWTSFRTRVGDLDISQRLPRSGQHN